MKTRLILGFLLVMFSVQTMGMGHPHNMFAARKLARAKAILAAPVGQNATKKQESAIAVNALAGRPTLVERVFQSFRRGLLLRWLVAVILTGQPVGVYQAIIGQYFCE